MNKTTVKRDSAAVLADFGRSVGRTPMAFLTADVGDGRRRRIGIKMEGANPCGSIKDRTAHNLLASITPERLDEAALLVESTSGNLGLAMAWLARMMDLEFAAVVDPHISPVILEQMRHLGARIEMVDEPDGFGGYLMSRLRRVDALRAQQSGVVWPDQYANPANPEVHSRTTGPEISSQTAGAIDAVFVAASTGGTLAGISHHFRATSPSTRIVGVDAVGSVVFTGEAGPRRLSGIGSSRKSSFLTPMTYDDHVLVEDAVAFAFCREVRRRAGISLGGSAGAAFAGCVRYLAAHPQVRHPVCIAADFGGNYARTVFDDGYLARERIVIGPDLLRAGPNLPPVRISSTVEWQPWR